MDNNPIVRMIRAAVLRTPPPDPGPLNEAVRAVARSKEMVFPFPEPGQALPLGEILRARHRRGNKPPTTA